MDYQSLTQSMTSARTVKKFKVMAPFLVSFSVFSFIFSNSPLYSFLIRSFKFYFGAFPLQVLSHTVNKGWIFLICNGILVVLASTSSMVVHSPSGFDLYDLIEKKIGNGLQTTPVYALLEGQDSSETTENAVSEGEGKEKANEEVEEEEAEKYPDSIVKCEEHGEQGSGFLQAREGEDVEEAEELSITYVDPGNEDSENESETGLITMEEDQAAHLQLPEDQEEEDEEQGMEGLSTEELNKKFDDFIRRMKEELRIEAQSQQQLIIVK